MAKDSVFQEAITRVDELLEAARGLPLRDPTAMSLATVDRRGRPAVRVVLLRGWDQRGLVFFTNSLSRKGRELAENPFAAVCLYWEGLGQQVRLEGRTIRVADDENDAYWSGRPRESQIGAWASQQSERLSDRQQLVDRIAKYEAQFKGHVVPRPPHWYGYRLKPARIEFWTSGSARLHDRDVYEQQADGWRKFYLYP